MDHPQMLIRNNCRFKGDSRKVGPFENYVKHIFKKFENLKSSARNIDRRQIFICNDRNCISIHNLDGLRHVKDVTKSRTIDT